MKSFKQYLMEITDAKNVDPKLAYHDVLNPALWSGESLKEKVSAALKKIANEFIEYLDVPSNSISDVILTGSNANYNWTDLSDCDLHIIFNRKKLKSCCDGKFLDDCFQAKKTVWNDSHDIKIYGFDVELYAQPDDDDLVATGVYSIRDNKWFVKPEQKQIKLDNFSIKSKSAEIMDQIDTLIDNRSDDTSAADKLKDKIKKLRQSGLKKGGEFSVENLVFKSLRNNGYLDKLSKYLKTAHDKDLSLE